MVDADFHYNFIKKHFDAELLFTDTDSLTYKMHSMTTIDGKESNKSKTQ